MIYFAMNFHHPISTIAFALFLLRSVGFVLFEITDIRKFLIYCPNFYENFCLIILLFSSLSIELTSQVVLIALLLTILTKIPQELLVHGTSHLQEAKIGPSFVNKVRELLGFPPLS